MNSISYKVYAEIDRRKREIERDRFATYFTHHATDPLAVAIQILTEDYEIINFIQEYARKVQVGLEEQRKSVCEHLVSCKQRDPNKVAASNIIDTIGKSSIDLELSRKWYALCVKMLMPD